MAVLETTAPVSTFVLVVIASTWFGGTKPGLLATAIALPVLVYYLPPQRVLSIDVYQIQRIAYFLAISGFIIWLVAEERGGARALRASHDELQGLIDTIPAMAWIAGPDGKMEYLNRRWLDYSGLPLAQALAMGHETIHPEDTSAVWTKWRHSMATGEPFECEMRLRRADGVYRAFLVRTVPLRDEAGQIRRWYGTSFDIERRKSAEQALRESAARLQHLSRRLIEVQEEERRHFSRELHDEFGQLLVAINMHLHAAESSAGDAAQSDLAEATALLQRAVEQVRGLALELRPAILETEGLDGTLRWLAQQHEQRTGIPTRVSGRLDGVPAEIAIAGFRVVQQALTNIVLHAQAQNTWIELAQAQGAIEILVADDGRGFEVEKTLQNGPGAGHLGLLGMRERVEFVGGALEVDSTPGKGTRIRVRIPTARTVDLSALSAP